MTPLSVVESCPLCDSRLVLRHNRTSGDAFVGCTAFPGCKFSEPTHARIQKMAERIAELEDGTDVLPVVSPDVLVKRLRTLISLFHPDRHDGHPLANQITAELTRLRDEVAA